MVSSPTGLPNRLPARRSSNPNLPDMTQQLDTWRGDFGEAYTDRNQIDWRTRLPGFREVLAGLELPRVVEVGCNRGHNLIALSELLGETSEIIGIEPNRYARELARQASPKFAVLEG